MINKIFIFIRNVVTTIVTISAIGISGFIAGAVYVMMNSDRYDSLVNVINVAKNSGKVKVEKLKPKINIIKSFARNSET